MTEAPGGKEALLPDPEGAKGGEAREAARPAPQTQTETLQQASPSSPAAEGAEPESGRAAEELRAFTRDLEEALFGPAAQALLAAHRETIAAATSAFLAAFPAVTGQLNEGAAIHAALLPQERARHLEKVGEHLLRLLSPGTQPSEITAAAARVGFVHTLIGLPPDERVLTIGLYAHFLRVSLEDRGLPRAELQAVMHVIEWRLLLTLRLELKTGHETHIKALGLITPPLPEGLSREAMLQAELERLAAHPAARAVLLFLPDGAEHLTLAFSAGPAPPSAALRVPLAADEAEHGPPLVREAWFSGEIETLVSLASNSHYFCPAEAEALGWRSAAAIPLAPGGKSEAVLVLIGAFPHQFSSPLARMWLHLVQLRWLRLSQQALGQAPPPPAREEVRRRRESLYQSGLVLLVQPICDLATLRPVKGEPSPASAAGRASSSPPPNSSPPSARRTITPSSAKASPRGSPRSANGKRKGSRSIFPSTSPPSPSSIPTAPPGSPPHSPKPGSPPPASPSSSSNRKRWTTPRSIRRCARWPGRGSALPSTISAPVIPISSGSSPSPSMR